MSGSRIFFDGRRQPGRSNFVQTCNLLSRYIKEKGSLRDLNLEIGGKVESVEAIVRPGSAQSSATTSNILTNKPSMEHQQPPMAPISSMSKDNPKSSQLTIIYSGRVLVFDDYPAEMAKELMAFAKKESSQMSCGVVGEKPSSSTTVAPVSSSRDGLPPRPQASTSSHKSSKSCKEKTSSPRASTSGAGQNSAYPEANGSDLPIARRSSLHRFLEKRKDRAAARGPYQQVQEQPGSSSKGDEQLELRL